MILYLPVFFILNKKGIGLLRQLSYLLSLWSLLIIIFATIFFVTPITFSPEVRYLNLRPFAWLVGGQISQIELAESVGNVLMFIPLGFLIPVVFKKMRKFYLTSGIIFAISFAIEFLQYFMGRISDIDDLIANLIGGMVGYGIFKVMNQLFQSNRWWHKLIGIISEGSDLDVQNRQSIKASSL